MASHEKHPAPPNVVDAEVPDGGYEYVPPEALAADEPFDSVIVSSVPVCEEKTGHVLKMNFYNAAGQLVR